MTFRSRLGNETRATIRLALPLVAGQLCTVGMNVVETLLAGHRGGLTLAAVGVATPVWSIALLVSMGLMLAVPPSVAQLAGAGRRDAIAVVFRQALWLAVVTGVLLLAGLRFGGELLRRAGVDAAIIPEAEAFLDLLAFGAPAQSLFLAARGLSEGLGLTRPTMWFGLLGVLVLAPLGWALMHGRAGLPALGIRGLGLAYAIVLWTQALAMLAFLARHRNYRGLGLFACWQWPHWPTISSLLGLALPMCFALLMEGGLFVATALMMGTLGPVAAAAHQVAINVATVTFMVPLGVALAITVRVGQAVGQDDVAGVRWAGFTGIGLVFCVQVLSALILALGAMPIAAAYTRDAAVAATAAQLLGYAALFQLADGVQAASNGALRGLKDTRVPAVLTVLSYWAVGMVCGAGLGFGHGLGAQGLWTGLIVGLVAAAVSLFWRFSVLARRAGWKRLADDRAV